MTIYERMSVCPRVVLVCVCVCEREAFPLLTFLQGLQYREDCLLRVYLAVIALINRRLLLSGYSHAHTYTPYVCVKAPLISVEVCGWWCECMISSCGVVVVICVVGWCGCCV